MKQKFSLWASDARVLTLPETEWESWHFSTRSGHKADNVDALKYGYVWLSDHEVEIVLPKLEERIAEITEAIEERIRETYREAEGTVRGYREQLQNLLALTYEAEGE
jgi:hypothetical protein